jgi:L-iditol 2-dehydrogenase
MHGIRDVRLETRQVPTPGPKEVLVRIQRVGVCGSDVHYFVDGRIGPYVVEAPMILGHESAGVVAAIGSEVSSPWMVRLPNTSRGRTISSSRFQTP